MKKLERCPDGEAWKAIKNIDWANENFNELEERLESLSGAIDTIAMGIVGGNFHSRIQYNYNHIKALEEKVDNLEEALIGLARGVIGAEGMMRDIRFVLMGYSEGENTYAEGEV